MKRCSGLPMVRRSVLSLGFSLFLAASSALALIHVPGDVPDLQTALDQAPNGETIVLAGGFYPAPAGGFVFTREPGWILTIQAAQDALVTLDGLGSEPIFRLEFPRQENTDGSFVFENITFSNGFSETAGVAGGLTMRGAVVTLINCHFDGNQTLAAETGGGAVRVDAQSRLYLLNSRFTGNDATRRGGAIEAIDESKLFVQYSEFSDNRVDGPSHHPLASGGAIFFDASEAVMANTAFVGNRAGYAGGAISIRQDWSRSPQIFPTSQELDLNNCYFLNNAANRHPDVTTPGPSRGGALYIEDSIAVTMGLSRVHGNTAENGGAIAVYRGYLGVGGTDFRGNYASGSGPRNGFGGTLWGYSDDQNDASTEGGAINRPSVWVSLGGNIIQGRLDGPSARNGGCLNFSGDLNRSYGLNGVEALGEVDDNRALVNVSGVTFDHCDVVGESSVSGSGGGGAVDVVHGDFRLTHSLVMNSEALGGHPQGTGGGARLSVDTEAYIADSTFAYNFAHRWAGGVVFLGGALDFVRCQFFGNGILPTSAPSADARAVLGAASEETSIYLSPGIDDFGSFDTPITGRILDSSFYSTTAPAIVENDRMDGPVNDVWYDLNRFYGHPTVVSNPLVGPQTVDSLNGLTIFRTPPVKKTVKSILPNQEFANEPQLGHLEGGLRSSPLESTPLEGRPPDYVSFAWIGPDPVRLNDEVLVEKTGLREKVSHSTYLYLLDPERRFSSFRSFVSSPDIRAQAGRSILPSDGSPIDNFFHSRVKPDLRPPDCIISNRTAACGLNTFTSVVPEKVYVFVFDGPGGAWDTFVTTRNGQPEAFHVFSDDLESDDLTGWSASVP